MSERKDDAVNIDERRPVTMPIAMLFSLLGATVAATVGYAAISSKIDTAVDANAEMRIHVQRLEERTRVLETTLSASVAAMRQDVEWIRADLQQRRR